MRVDNDVYIFINMDYQYRDTLHSNEHLAGAHTHSHTLTCRHTHTHAYGHTYPHTQTHTHTYTHTHITTHTHTDPLMFLSLTHKITFSPVYE